MKFSLFVHMERISPSDPEPRLYQEMLELCRIADEGGMHAIWTGEHHGMSFTIAPNPLLNLVDLARRTKHVRLGTGTVIAPFWHPIKLAGEAAMADIIMDGRLDLGIARGAYGFEYERLMPGMDAWGAGGRMRELIPSLAITVAAVGLLQRDGMFMAGGTLLALGWVTALGVLIFGLITGAGFAATLVAEHAPWLADYWHRVGCCRGFPGLAPRQGKPAVDAVRGGKLRRPGRPIRWPAAARSRLLPVHETTRGDAAR